MRSVIVRHLCKYRRTNKAKVRAHSTLSLFVSCSNARYVSTNKLSQNMNGSLSSCDSEISGNT
jgi:hypothetical protein